MTNRTPIGLHKITVSVHTPDETSVGEYVRTIYQRLDGSYQVYFRGAWIKADHFWYDDLQTHGGYTAHYVHTDQPNIKSKKSGKSISRPTRG